MHKQSFDLVTGQCLDDPEVSLAVWPDAGHRRWVEVLIAGPERRSVTALSPVLAGTQILVTAQRRADELSLALGRRGAEVTVARVARGRVRTSTRRPCSRGPGRCWRPASTSWS